jgi:hypothetical protein
MRICLCVSAYVYIWRTVLALACSIDEFAHTINHTRMHMPSVEKHVLFAGTQEYNGDCLVTYTRDWAFLPDGPRTVSEHSIRSVIPNHVFVFRFAESRAYREDTPFQAHRHESLQLDGNMYEAHMYEAHMYEAHMYEAYMYEAHMYEAHMYEAQAQYGYTQHLC